VRSGSIGALIPNEIDQIIRKLPKNKAPGNDNINSKILKEISDAISGPLTYIFSLSFITGLVPDLLKIAKVVPIYKKGEKIYQATVNYRPISLLSIFDKILEKLMYKRLSSFLEANKFFYEYQFGFRNKKAQLSLTNPRDACEKFARFT